MKDLHEKNQIKMERSFRDLRLAAGITQIEIAQRIGINQSTVSHIETITDLDCMTLRTLSRFVDACGYRVEIQFVKKE